MHKYPVSVVSLKLGWVLAPALCPGWALGFLLCITTIRVSAVLYKKPGVLFMVIIIFWQFVRTHSFPKGLHWPSIPRPSCFSPAPEIASGREPIGPTAGLMRGVFEFLKRWFPEADFIRRPGGGDCPAVDARGVAFGFIRENKTLTQLARWCSARAFPAIHSHVSQPSVDFSNGGQLPGNFQVER